jgi:hypothetical protein
MGKGLTAGRRLLVGDHFAEVGDVFFDVGDFFGPGGDAFVGDPGGVLAFRFGEGFEGVLEFLLQGGAGHRGRLSLESRVTA